MELGVTLAEYKANPWSFYSTVQSKNINDDYLESQLKLGSKYYFKELYFDFAYSSLIEDTYQKPINKYKGTSLGIGRTFSENFYAECGVENYKNSRFYFKFGFNILIKKEK